MFVESEACSPDTKHSGGPRPGIPVGRDTLPHRVRERVVTLFVNSPLAGPFLRRVTGLPSPISR